jgi:ribosomal protein S18 acetylase RimI-like enzyme
MEIRRAKKEDFRQYLKLKKYNLKEYSNLINERIRRTDKDLKKEFNEFFSSKKRFLFVLEKDKEIKGYLIGTLIVSDYKKTGYIDDLFVSKNFRKKGAAKKLIREFIKILKRKKIKRFRLGVSIKNNKATRLYKNVGFKIKHYDMEKKI